jgi:cbb3-type cytochrome oxidase subunit 3
VSLRARVSGILVAAVALALSVAPSAASACAVCTGGQDDETLAAFLAGTITLSLLPLAMIGGLVWWLRRRARQLAAEEAAGVIRLPVSGSRSGPRPRSAA